MKIYIKKQGEGSHTYEVRGKSSEKITKRSVEAWLKEYHVPYNKVWAEPVSGGRAKVYFKAPSGIIENPEVFKRWVGKQERIAQQKQTETQPVQTAAEKPYEISRTQSGITHTRVISKAELDAIKQQEADAQNVDSGARILTPEEAYDRGLISFRQMQETAKAGQVIQTSKSDIEAAEAYKKQLAREYPQRYERISPALAPYEELSIQQEEREKAADKIIQDPLFRAAYIFDRDLIGMGTVTDYASTILTGGDWETKRQGMLKDYAYEVMQRKPGDPTPAITAAAKTGIVAGAMAATSGAAPAVVKGVAGTGLRVAYGISLGSQLGETIKNPSAEGAAKSFVMASPLMIAGAVRGVQALTKPTYSAEIAGTKHKVTTQGAKTTSKDVTKINIYEKGLAAKLHITKPTKVGTVYGVTKGTAVTSHGKPTSVQIGKGDFVYAGTVKGQNTFVIGKEYIKSHFTQSGNIVKGTSVSAGKSNIAVSSTKTSAIQKQIGRTDFTSSKIVSHGQKEVWQTSFSGKGATGTQIGKKIATSSYITKGKNIMASGSKANNPTGNIITKPGTATQVKQIPYTPAQQFTSGDQAVRAAVNIATTQKPISTGGAVLGLGTGRVVSGLRQRDIVVGQKQRPTYSSISKQSSKQETKPAQRPQQITGTSPALQELLVDARSVQGYVPGQITFTGTETAQTPKQSSVNMAAVQAALSTPIGSPSASFTSSSPPPKSPAVPMIPIFNRGRKQGRLSALKGLYFERKWPVATGSEGIRAMFGIQRRKRGKKK